MFVSYTLPLSQNFIVIYFILFFIFYFFFYFIRIFTVIVSVHTTESTIHLAVPTVRNVERLFSR